MLHWLTDNVSVFKIQHDAHREFGMSVEQHLLHRARIGDAPLYFDQRDRDRCIAGDRLWELRVILPDGAAFDLVGPTLENCIRATQSLVEQRQVHKAA